MFNPDQIIDSIIWQCQTDYQYDKACDLQKYIKWLEYNLTKDNSDSCWGLSLEELRKKFINENR